VTLIFHPLAQRELIAASRFYETRAAGLGADFIRQVERTLADIIANPSAGSRFAGGMTRRRLTQRFPFGVVYEFESNNIAVLAVMHLRRRLGYWKRRRAGSSSRR
jgi:plasmid stabilization system protein ParE